MDDLQWNILRKETANSKHQTLKSSTSAPQVHNLSRLKIDRNNPSVQVLSTFGELEIEKPHHYHQSHIPLQEANQSILNSRLDIQVNTWQQLYIQKNI